jgi:hypothetical protein
LEISVEEFKEIRKKLNHLSDFSKFRYPRGMLFTMLVQKKVDRVKVHHGSVYNRLEELSDFWRKNKKLPRWLGLTPMMRVRLLLKSLEFSKKEIKKCIENPDEVDDEVLKRIIWKSVFTDYIYSPIAVRNQFARGRLGELIIHQWLENRGYEFKTEKELRKESIKTPDFYFSEPISVRGEDINWIESKALFGDPKTHWVYWKKQYSKYIELFGNGFVVYWFGKVYELNRNVKICKEEYFRNDLMNFLLDMRILTVGLKGRKKGDIKRIVEKFGVRTVVEVDVDTGIEAEFTRSGGELKRLISDFEDVYSKEFLSSIFKLVDSTSEGRVLIVGRERDWRRCKRGKMSWVLRNMGFSVYHLK